MERGDARELCILAFGNLLQFFDIFRTQRGFEECVFIFVDDDAERFGLVAQTVLGLDDVQNAVAMLIQGDDGLYHNES